ncbi:MAG: transglycosylase SLT domain-containing protein [Marinilabiliaceae bacterium]|nr:transglycosylase SLT domain-containing protein [Marinilabiliaceae bacterium]
MIKLTLYFSLLIFTINTYGQIENVIPDISTFVIKQRLSELDNQTPISLEYNEYTQAYIDVYTVKRRDHLANIVGRSELYFPLFEAYLDKYELPLELKYLAIVESALNPKAKSTSGAMGLWQFLYDAAQMFDLRITSFVDERCDPIKSTEAACKYLSYLHRNFDDWLLALAAYNVGPGEVKKAIVRSGGKKNYWELRKYLPVAAQGYVPAFIAANFVMNNYRLYDIKPVSSRFKKHEIDTLHINKSLSFEQINKITGIEIEVIEQLNPMYIKNYIPKTNYPMVLYLPVNAVPDFLNHASELDEAKPEIKSSSWQKWDTKQRKHVVVRGEYFHKIAMNYNCTIEEIMKWNNLLDKNINAGKTLVVYEYFRPQKYFFIINETISLPKDYPAFTAKINGCKTSSSGCFND